MFKEFINNITTKAAKKINNIKDENQKYQQLLKTTTIFQNLFPIPTLNIESSPHKINIIITECPDINKEKAKLISSLIPISETFLSVNYTKEIKTNKEYYLIATNQYLWIITKQSYGAFHYQNINCQIIKNNLMSKTILINNILLEITGNKRAINTLISILANTTTRETIIKEKTNYLCGITPTYQKINNINSGISYDNNQNIVFHSKTQNYKCTTNDIAYTEILLDNTIIFSTNNYTSNRITNFQNSCYQITIRIITKDNQTIILPILNPNTFNTKYQKTDTIFITNLAFAKDIIETLQNITSKHH